MRTENEPRRDREAEKYPTRWLQSDNPGLKVVHSHTAGIVTKSDTEHRRRLLIPSIAFANQSHVASRDEIRKFMFSGRERLGTAFSAARLVRAQPRVGYWSGDESAKLRVAV